MQLYEDEIDELIFVLEKDHMVVFTEHTHGVDFLEIIKSKLLENKKKFTVLNSLLLNKKTISRKIKSCKGVIIFDKYKKVDQDIKSIIANVLRSRNLDDIYLILIM